MALLKAVYSRQEEIPETYRDLFAENKGQYELTGVEGIQTQANIDRLSEALTKERNDHKEVTKNLNVWGDLKHDEVRASLDRIPELEAAAERGK